MEGPGRRLQSLYPLSGLYLASGMPAANHTPTAPPFRISRTGVSQVPVRAGVKRALIREVPVRVERHTPGIVLRRRGSGPAEQRRKDARAGIRSDTIARSQKQAASLDPNVSIGCDGRIEVGDPPRSCRIDSAYNVKVDGARRGHAGHGNDPDTAAKLEVRIFLGRSDAGDGHRYERDQQSENHGPRRFAIANYPTLLAVQIILLIQTFEFAKDTQRPRKALDALASKRPNV